jgi:hypothetical protein
MWRRRLAIASPQTGEDTITTIFVFHHASRTLPSQSGGGADATRQFAKAADTGAFQKSGH